MFIKKNIFTLILTFWASAGTLCTQQDHFTISTSQRQATIPCTLSCTIKHPKLQSYSDQLRRDIEFTGQIEINSSVNSPCSINLYESTSKDPNTVTLNVVVKTALSPQPALQRRYNFTLESLTKARIQIAQDIMRCLTGEPGPYGYKLIFCKQISPREKKVCISNYRAEFEQPLTEPRTICTAPVWHPKLPIVFYSKFTDHNLELRSTNVRSRKDRMICSYDGLNLLPSFSPDGQQAVVCLSATGNSELYEYDHTTTRLSKKNSFKQITNLNANTISPSFTLLGDIIFCSDFEGHNHPQIYRLQRSDNTIHRLTSGTGYCADPSYSPLNNEVVYLRNVQGVLQIFSLSLNTSSPLEHQITTDQFNKYEPTISPCGKFIVCAYEQPYETTTITRQLAVFNRSNKSFIVLTHDPAHKSFPSWKSK